MTSPSLVTVSSDATAATPFFGRAMSDTASPSHATALAAMQVRHVIIASAHLLALASAPIGAQASFGVAEGHIHAIAGPPVAGAAVIVDGTAIATLTRSDGSFRLCGLPLGPQRLRVVALGFLSRVSEPFTVTGVDTALWEPHLLTYPIILDSIRPVSGVKALLVRQGDSIPHSGQCPRQ